MALYFQLMPHVHVHGIRSTYTSVVVNITITSTSEYFSMYTDILISGKY